MDTSDYQLFFEHAPTASAILDRQGNIIRVNRAFNAMLGLGASHLTPKSLTELVVEEDALALRSILSKLTPSTPLVPAQTRFRHADGRAIWFAWVGRVHEDRVHWIGRDISAETARAAEFDRGRLLSLFDEAPAPIGIYSGPEMVIQFVNQQYRKVVGITREVDGKRLLEAVPEIEEGLVQILKQVYETGHRFIGNEFPIRIDWENSGNITERHYNFVIEPTHGVDGRVNGVMSFAFDVSAQVEARRMTEKLNEQLEERVKERTIKLSAANQELEAFSYSVSHDLRSPLRGIAGFSQALSEDYASSLDATGQSYLGYIREGIQRMSRLIDDLLALSRLTRTELKVDEVDLSQIGRELAEELRRAEKGRKLRFEIDPELKVRGDSGLLRVALQNLLSNAVKFTARRDEANISLGRTDVKGMPVIFVRDNGAGFDMAYVSKLFGAFQRLHSPDEGYPGTGIGLATVRRIIHLHGGMIWAEGKVGEGSTFYFTL